MPGKSKGGQKKPVPPKKKLSEVELKAAALKAERQKVEDKCAAEFDALLKKYNCVAVPSVSAKGNDIRWGIHIMSKG